MKTNKWKTSFWILFIIWIGTSLSLIYQTMERNAYREYRVETDQDMELDLKQLSENLEGKLNIKDFDIILKRHSEDEKPITELGLNRIRLIFDNNGQFKKVTSEW